MTKTKKGFLYAGTIISIINAAVLFIVAIGFASITRMINFEFIKEAFEASEEATTITDEELREIVPIVKGLFTFIAVYAMGMGVALLIISVKLIQATNKDEDGKGLTIALLTLSAINGQLLPLGFMITALCLKSKPKVQDTQDIQTINE